MTRLSQAIWIMSFLAGWNICSSDTHCAFLAFRTLPGIVWGPTYAKLALCFIHLAAKAHNLNLVSSNSSGNTNIKWFDTFCKCKNFVFICCDKYSYKNCFWKSAQTLFILGIWFFFKIHNNSNNLHIVTTFLGLQLVFYIPYFSKS